MRPRAKPRRRTEPARIRDARSSRGPLAAAGFLFFLLLGACSAPEPPPQTFEEVAELIRREIPRTASLPIYKVGDRFVYDDGSAEQVVAVDGEKVTWRRHTGSTFVRYRNVALPHLAWDFRRARGEADVTADPQALWPLEVGKSVSFAQRVRSTRKDTGENRKYDRTRYCRVGGEEEVTVPAGTFATWRIVCMRAGTARSPRARTRTHTLWYAPAVGHYVKEAQDVGGRETSVRQLTQMEYAGTPQAIGTSRNLEELVQRTLETRLNGELVQWATPDGRHKVEVVPTATERRGDGIFCRRFNLKISTGEQDQITRRAACRTPQGWRAVDAS